MIQFTQKELTSPRVSHFQTPREAYAGVTENFLTDRDGWTDGLSGIHTYSYDHIIYIHNAGTLDLGLNEVGFTMRRWKTFLEHYVPAEDLSIMYYNTIYGKKAEEAGMPIKSTFDHRLGTCLLGITTRRKPVVVHLYSRACVWAPTGVLDISLASLIAARLAKDLRSDEPPVAVWHVSQINLYAAKSLGWLHASGFLDRVLAGEYRYSMSGLLVEQEVARAQANYSTYRTYASSLQRLQRVREGRDPFTPAVIPESHWHGFVDLLGTPQEGETTDALTPDDWARHVPEYNTTRVPDKDRLVNRIAASLNLKLDSKYAIGSKQARRFVFEFRSRLRGPAGVGG